MPTTKPLASVAFLTMVCSLALAGGPGDPPSREHSTVERMSPERLEAAHRDVERMKAARRELPTLPGLNDYRAIFHAHAEDSNHTGGTRPEMLEDAKAAGVSIIMLSDHYRPPKDFITDTWRGIHEGVLFIPGSETKGFLIHPMESMMDVMDRSKEEIIEAVTQGDGLIFLSHVEERRDHPMDGLTGMEIYNRHADAKDDAASIMTIAAWMTDPVQAAKLAESVRRYPDEILATQLDYPKLYLEKWDAESQKQRVVGVAANDCHHNQVFLVKMVDEETVILGTIVDDDEGMRKFTAAQRPGIREMTKGRKPGDVLVQLDFDPYRISFHNVSTHVLAPELTEPAVRAAVKAGHAYVSHDWMCDPTGFAFVAVRESAAAEFAVQTRVGIMGDEVEHSGDLRLVAEFPLPCMVRILKDGKEVSRMTGDRVQLNPDGPGVYRVEGWVTVDGEERVWIYSNPIYVR